MRGRKNTPTHLKIVRGNPGKRGISKNEPKPEGDLFAPPGDMPAAAVPFWNQAIAAAPVGLLKNLDQRVLMVWAIAAWLHSDAASKIARGTTLVQSKRGEIFQHPALAIMNKQALIMMKAAAEMGFSPASRTRVSTNNGGASGNAFDQFA